MYKINPNVECIECIKCYHRYPLKDYFIGCPRCFEKGKPSSVSLNYKNFNLNNNQSGFKKYTDVLPYLDFPTIGEGSTPTVRMKRLGDELGLENLWIKNEGQNPTGSHKDRYSPFVVARAISLGFETVAVASSGNAGVSIATYSAAANLKCVVLTTKNMNPIWKQAIVQTGAEIIYKDKPMDRWEHLQRYVLRNEWYPATNFINPPVGSNPFGVQGLKTLAFEIIEDFEQLPNIIIIPSSRGDLLWGVWKGFNEALENGLICDIPKLIAVEPFPRLKAVLGGDKYTDNFEGDSTHTPSVGGTTVTYQSIQAIKNSKGKVEVVPSFNAINEQEHLGKYGIYAERSSSLVLGALNR
ncbi:pyridoxal-phosphate dependent enzyme [Ornithinibacillus sp. BX22]|uniref:Pyridoxal-phosphate dependent enzyme n=1 Tax=Ornithinibacillus hominis TaxID=2763055 RepID=A0A923L5U3_9BACI|nr:pyridoxal-phosphate dependent enzyme [Ornithinibacillus hominis]MBC5636999.1 pyridoxal-phosphate dependent enzyme [Ornithinibacillus hominis]